MRNIIIALSLLLLGVAALAASHNYTITVATTFTPLHTYFMASTGCDNTDTGLSPAHAWCQPDNDGHVGLVCGDVIISAATGGTAYPFIGPSHSPANCPSTSGGIDGTGGIYFAIVLCGGSDLEACVVNNATGPAVSLEQVDNWSVQGFKVTNSGGTSGRSRAFESRNCSDTGAVTHHHALINNIAYNSEQGFTEGACAGANNRSTDYWAVVGNIAQNAAQQSGGICVAAIDVVGPRQFDSVAGTHMFVYGNFSYANTNVGCQSLFDTEDYMADTLDVYSYGAQVVFSNNMGWAADRNCIELTDQQLTSVTPTVKLYNNTCFHNLQQTGADNFNAEIMVSDNNIAMTWIVTIQNNLVYNPLATSGGGNPIAAFGFIFNKTPVNFTNGGTGNENFFRANRPSCTLAFCNTTFDAQSDTSSATLGTNTYTNPAFTNTSDLLTNWVGTPTCTGFENITQCMGWNAVTGTLTTNTPISDLTPTAGGTSGKGYQKPTMTCTANADFPIWLKGVVYLHWTGSIVQQKAGLVNVPCGM